MKPDISFIPEEMIPSRLLYLANQPIEAPNHDINTADKKRYQQYISNRENYFNFILELAAFAHSQAKEENYKLAKKCCEYLLEIGNGNKVYKIKELLKYCNEKIEDA